MRFTLNYRASTGALVTVAVLAAVLLVVLPDIAVAAPRFNYSKPLIAPEPSEVQAGTNTLVLAGMFIVVPISLYVYALAVMPIRMKDIRGVRGSEEELFFVLLVPALNEEQVIGKTLTSLLALRGNFLVLVIDDASDDGTVAAVAPFLADPRVRLLERPPEQARRGKGDVLNTGYAAVRNLNLVEHYGPENVIIGVFDSDARVEPNFLQAVAPYFHDPEVAGTQCAVRMYNAEQNLLTFWQNLEFVTWGNALSLAKSSLGSTTLGGNGQCVRLAALSYLGTNPWDTSSLTEDLDISLRLVSRGWQLRFCPLVAVYQEAIPEFGKLVRQRSRWMQGHLVCWQHLPGLLRDRLPLLPRLDLILFLLLPAVVLPVGLTSIIAWGYFLDAFGHWGALELLGWYAMAFMMSPLATIYLKADRRYSYSLWQSVLHGHLFAFFSFVWLLAGVAAFWNILLGRRGWAKTSRVTAEPEVELPGITIITTEPEVELPDPTTLAIKGSTAIQGLPSRTLAPDRKRRATPEHRRAESNTMPRRLSRRRRRLSRRWELLKWLRSG